jgi:hypothetical protein
MLGAAAAQLSPEQRQRLEQSAAELDQHYQTLQRTYLWGSSIRRDVDETAALEHQFGREFQGVARTTGVPDMEAPPAFQPLQALDPNAWSAAQRPETRGGATSLAGYRRDIVESMRDHISGLPEAPQGVGEALQNLRRAYQSVEAGGTPAEISARVDIVRALEADLAARFPQLAQFLN